MKQLLTELSPINCANTQVSILQYGANDQIVHKFSDAQQIEVITQKVTIFFLKNIDHKLKIDAMIQTDIEYTGTRPEVAIETSLQEGVT